MKKGSTSTESRETRLSNALSKALLAFEHVRKYLPNDDKLSDADKMAIRMAESARKQGE